MKIYGDNVQFTIGRANTLTQGYGVWDITSSEGLYIKGKYYTCDERMEVTGSRGVLWLTRCTAEMLSEVAPVIMYKDGKINQTSALD